MILKLINFRCYSNITFHFPDQGTILLWGTSGIGKTSIFKAINFVLYDKESKVVKYGEKKCEVILEYKDIIISRKKCPNYLTFRQGNVFAENDIAQYKINDYFGTNFLLTGYMPQKNSDRFFLMSSYEKSSFLQSLSVRDYNIDELRKKVKEKIKTRKEQLLLKTREKQFLVDSCSFDYQIKLSKPILKMDMKNLTSQELYQEEIIKKDQYNVKLKDCRSKLNVLQVDIQQLIQQKERLNYEKKRLDELNQQFDQAINKQNELKTINDNSSITENKKLLNEYQSIIKVLNLKDKFNNLKKDYEDLLQEEKNQIQTNIDRYSTLINNESKFILDESERNTLSSSLETSRQISLIQKDIKTICGFVSDDVDKMIETLEEKTKSSQDIISKNSDEIDNIQPIINEIQIDIKQKDELLKEIRKNITDGSVQKHKCPKCMTGLMIHKNTIKEFIVDVDELKREEGSVEKQIKSLTSDLKNHKDTFDKLSKNVSELKQNVFMIDNLLKRLRPFSKIDISIDTIKIKQQLDKDVEYRNKIELYQKEIDKNEKMKNQPSQQLVKKKQQLLSLQSEYKQMRNLITCEIDEEMEEYQERIDELKNKILQEQQILETIKENDKNVDSLKTQIEKCSFFINSFKEGCLEATENDIHITKQQIERYELNIEKMQKRIQHIESFHKQMELYEEQQTFTHRLLEIESNEKICMRALSTAEELLSLINEAESHSLLQTIQNINEDLEEFISAFFGDQFNVSLQTFRQTKDGDKKAEIDIQIIKDGEQIPIDGLSGGEYDRLSLALFLSFNKASKSSFILLDECLASLHPELVEEIVELIKTKMTYKLVMFTLHQANTVIFDDVIDICSYRC